MTVHLSALMGKDVNDYCNMLLVCLDVVVHYVTVSWGVAVKQQWLLWLRIENFV